MPDEVHVVLRRRAASAGMSLQEYLLAQLVEDATSPTLDELLERVGQRNGGQATLREAAKLSQQEVAARAELSESMVAKMEQGRKADPRASTIIALAKALSVRPGQLIEDLTKPPEGAFKKKKGKKKKEVLVGAGVGAEDGASTTPAIEVAIGALGLTNGEHEPKKKKKKVKSRDA